MLATSGFPTTRWTLVLRAGDGGSEAANRALEELCSAYRYPVYAFIRRLGNPPDEAQDLTQDFFARFLEKRHVTSADPSRGRFRSFLLTAAKRFLIDQADRRSAEKRGGRTQFLTLDWAGGEERYIAELADHRSPDRLFEREWARAFVARVTKDAGNAMERDGRTPFYDRMKQYLHGSDEALPYADLARELNTSEGALKVAFHRMRRRYREFVRAEIAHLVADPDQIDDEARYLLEALRG
jgi:RNA polymerase sigma factor (sigma-70 family)